MIERIMKRSARVGIFAVAHKPYWEQFPGLRDNLAQYHVRLCKKIMAHEVELIDFGIVDDSEQAYRVAEEIRAKNVDVLFTNMVTYATSSTFAPIIWKVDCPVVLVALQPRFALDYTNASTFMQLENDNICAVPEFTGVSERMGKKVHDVILGTLDNDAEADSELEEWCEIAKVLNGLKGARFGLMGHTMEAMYDMHTDPTALSATFGVHVPLLEIDDVVALYQTVTESEIQNKRNLILSEFSTPNPVSDPITEKLTDSDLFQAAKTAVALDKLVKKYRLSGLAYYYGGQENSIQREVVSSFIVGNSILNAQGIPMCGEFDIKTLMAMFIMDRLDIGGSFAEFHPFDFKDNFIMVGHDGPHHLRIAQGKPILRSLSKYHGKPGHGASVEFKLKEGPITMLGITQTFEGKYKFVIGEGISKAGPIPPTGNTNTRGFFEPTTKDFVKRWVMEGPTHHYALGIGHHAQTIQKIATVLNIRSVIVK